MRRILATAAALALSAPVAAAAHTAPPAQAVVPAGAAAPASAARAGAAVPAAPDRAAVRAAVPAPRPDEWWFPPWSIEQKVWPVTQGQGVTVAVLDTGVNAAMPELAGAVVPGGDTSGRGTDGRTDFSKDGHGTGMAIFIAGRGGGRTGLVGIAPKAKILPVSVVVEPGSQAMAEALGIRFAVDHGARVINMSLASPTTSGCPVPLMNAVAYAVHHDVVIVAGAGNSGQEGNPVMYPGTCPGVLAVGATDDYSRPWSNTEAQDYVSVAAPGVDMPSASKSESYYFPHSSGTSNASALVSAAAALVRSANPHMSAREVVARLIGTALDVSAPGRDAQTGYGIIRIPRAMNPAAYPLPAGSPNPPYERFDQWEHPDRAVPSSSGPATTSPGGSGKAGGSGRPTSGGGLVPLVVGLAVVTLIVVAVVVRRGGRGGGAPAAGAAPDDSLARPGTPGASLPPVRPELAGHREGQGRPGQADRPGDPGPRGAAGWPSSSGPPPGFGKDARPTFEPPDDDR